ncbi:MAG: endonuclease/exonuclease/phosphatase family protein [Pseudomonadota bacterium]
MCCLLIWPGAGSAQTLRIATLHAELGRKGPGVLLRDLERDPQVAAQRQLIDAIDPDILLLTKVDVDAGGQTLAALQARFGFDHGYSEMPNSAVFAGDMRMGFGPFAGAGGMVLLSRHPIDPARTRSYSAVLWKDVPGAVVPLKQDGTSFFPAAVQQSLRLATGGLWVIESAGLHLVVFRNTTPAFDGPEDRNGLRQRDQLRLISQVLDKLQAPFVAVGNTNLDPDSGDGHRAAMRDFLSRPDLQDPVPRSPMGGVKTAFWDKPGPMRVSYVLPSRDLTVTGAGVVWPASGPLRDSAEQASRHRLVWVDITR